MRMGKRAVGVGMTVALTASLVGGAVTAQDGGNITFWSTEVEPARLQITQDIVEQFEAETGISVTLVPVGLVKGLELHALADLGQLEGLVAVVGQDREDPIRRLEASGRGST